MDKNLNVFIVSGESSGDSHSAKLMAELLKLQPEIKFYGIGGNEMEKIGLQSIVPISKISVVGIYEVVKNFFHIQKAYKQACNLLRSNNFNLVILVDFPGFNLRIAQVAKSLNIPICYYIAPQLWAWGKNRIKKLQNYINKLLVVFPFEENFFKSYGIDTEFVGHPLLDETIFKQEILPYEKRENIVALFPGSRKSEILQHKNLVIEIINKLKSRLPNYAVTIPIAKNLEKEFIEKELAEVVNFIHFTYDSLELLRKAKFGIIKSGTSNLESALLGLPFAMFYSTSFFTYFLAKKLINLNSLSIANILLNDKVVPEFIQKDAIPEKIVDLAQYVLTDQEVYQNFQNRLFEIRKILGGSGASSNAAKIIQKTFFEK
ncbi:MAG: lipid-A-disaccharide synthase [Ignavibacteria bacterium]|nr:lipid-A-disaccharide synthase [Ignavibacteria bacterium]